VADISSIKGLTLDGKFIEGETVTAKPTGYEGKVAFAWCVSLSLSLSLCLSLLHD
jgi:hypothetical protein